MAARENNAREPQATNPAPISVAEAAEQEAIHVHGARVHNLKNISFEIPHNAITVVTGVSGSGKSSLAFDTIYAEGQRRYIESLSAYARQFLERIEKPDVDEIYRHRPGHRHQAEKFHAQSALDRGHGHRNLRLSAVALCPRGAHVLHACGNEVRRDTMDEIAARVLALPNGPPLLRALRSIWRAAPNAPRQKSRRAPQRSRQSHLPKPSAWRSPIAAARFQSPLPRRPRA